MDKMTLRSPKPHVSWSQIELVERSPVQYYRKYFLNEPQFETIEMKFGSKFGKAMETGECDDPDILAVVSFAERYEVPEQEASAIYKGVKVLGYKDSATLDKSKFREYKTGVKPWTQERVNKHGQLDLYAWCDVLNGLPIPEIHLDWFPTHKVNGEVKLTGETHTFKRIVTQEDIKKIEARVIKALETIDSLFDNPPIKTI